MYITCFGKRPLPPAVPQRKGIGLVFALLRCRTRNADMLFPSCYSVRVRPSSVGRWRASPCVEIHLGMTVGMRVISLAESGPHVPCAPDGCQFFIMSETSFCLWVFCVFWSFPESVSLGVLQEVKRVHKRSKESTQCVRHLSEFASNLPAGSCHCTGTMDLVSDPSKTLVLEHLCPEIIECLSFLCSFPMPMQIPSNDSAAVLIAADLCRMSWLPCSGSGSTPCFRVSGPVKGIAFCFSCGALA